MASIKRRGEDGPYRARIRIDGREIARHFALKREAEAWLATQRASQLRGEWVDPQSGKATVREYAERWLQEQAWRPSTAERNSAAFRNHVYPVLGRRPLGKLTTRDLQNWLRGLKLAPSTADVLKRTLGGMLADAVRERIIAVSPMVGVRHVVPDAAPVVPYTVAEVAGILDEVPIHHRALVALGAGCGLRISEALGLGVAQVDFLRRRVRVERQLLTTKVNGRWIYSLGPPKTKASNREVPLPRWVAEELALHLQRWPEKDHGFARLIFSGARGGPLNRRVSRTISKAAARSGIEGFHFHELRHHYASLLIASGRSVKAVQTALGHATATETLDTYGHLWPAEADLLAAALDDAWNANEPPAQVDEGLGGG